MQANSTAYAARPSAHLATGADAAHAPMTAVCRLTKYGGVAYAAAGQPVWVTLAATILPPVTVSVPW